MRIGKHSFNKKEIINAIGNIIMIGALCFIIYRFTKYPIDYKMLFSERIMVFTVVAVILYAICMVINAIPWLNIVEYITRTELNYFEVTAISTKANILKYIPGNIFQYIGRNELAIKKGLKHSDVALSTVIDVALNLFAITVSALLLSWDGILAWGKMNGFRIVHGVFIIPLVLLVVLVVMRKKLSIIRNKFLFLLRKEFAFILMKNFLLYLMLNVINTSITVVLFFILEPESLQLSSVLIIGGAVMASWIIGFITPGAPGGLGVRETALLFFINNHLASNNVILGLVINRFISLIGDLMAFFVGRVFNYKTSRENRGIIN